LLTQVFPFPFLLKRFELALYTLLAKGAFCKTEHSEQGSPSAEANMDVHSDSSKAKGKNLSDNCTSNALESELGCLALKDGLEGHDAARNLLVELADGVVDFQPGVSVSKQQAQQAAYTQSNLGTLHPCDVGQSSSLSNSFSVMNANGTSCSYVEMPISAGTSGLESSGVAMEGPSEDGSYHLNNNNWLASNQSRNCNSLDPSGNGLILNDWERCDMPQLSWGGRVVGRRQVKGYAKGNCGFHREDYDTFINIFEGGSLLYCNMSFEALLNVRKQLEELGFPCKAVNDGLWLQVCSNSCLLPIL
jgi:hypothetical protein